MTDPLSVTAAIVGITVPAIQVTRLLLNDLENLKDAPKTVRRLKDDVHEVNAVLDLIKGADERELELLGPNIAEQLKNTINSCTRACDLFRTDLQKWTKHSGDRKLAWQDRAKVGFFKQKHIMAMSNQLQSCKLAINSVVSVANWYSSVRHSNITEEIKTSITQNQIEVEGALTTANKQLAVLESKIEKLSLSSDDEKANANDEGKIEAMKQLEEEGNALKASRQLLDALLSKVQEEAVAKAAAGYQSSSIPVTFGSHNSGFQAGIIHGGVSGLTFGRR